MLEHYFARPETVDRIRGSWIAPAIEKYVSWLVEHHYAIRIIWRRVPLLVGFGEFARRRGARSLAALPRHVDAFVGVWVSRTSTVRQKRHREVRGPIEQMLRVALPGRLAHRRGRGVRLPFTEKAPGFFAYLRDERGLRPATIAHYSHYLRAFESYLGTIGVRRLRDLSPAIIGAFIARPA